VFRWERALGKAVSKSRFPMIQDRPMMKDRILSWLGAITNVNVDKIGIFSPNVNMGKAYPPL